MLSAEICGSDGGEVLESFAPTKFSLRVLAEGPPRPGANPCLDWSRDGTLYVAESAPDGTSGVVAWDVVRERARAVALNISASKVEFLVAGSGEPLLLGYRPAYDRPTQVAFVKRGFLQPALEPSFSSKRAAFWPDRVFLCDRRSVLSRASDGDGVWKLRGRQVDLGATGTVAILDRKKLALFDPLAKTARKTWDIPNKHGSVTAVRRRALVQDEPTIIAVFDDHVIERSLDPLHSVPSPSLRHVAQFTSPTSFVLTEVRTGEAQTIPCPPDIVEVNMSWSPSGRRLALAAATGELYLLEGE